MKEQIRLDRLGDRWRLSRNTRAGHASIKSSPDCPDLILGTVRCRETALRLWLALMGAEGR